MHHCSKGDGKADAADRAAARNTGYNCAAQMNRGDGAMARSPSLGCPFREAPVAQVAGAVLPTDRWHPAVAAVTHQPNVRWRSGIRLAPARHLLMGGKPALAPGLHMADQALQKRQP